MAKGKPTHRHYDWAARVRAIDGKKQIRIVDYRFSKGRLFTHLDKPGPKVT